MSRERNNRYRTNRSRNNCSRPSNLTVFPKNDEHPDRTIKRFLRKTKKYRIIEQFKEHVYYEKPSAKRRRKKLRREKLIKKNAQRTNNS